MKLIEKKCPNCGAGLSFDKDDVEVTCEYCKKSYVIQRDDAKVNNASLDVQDVTEDSFSLKQKKSKVALMAIYAIIIVFIVLILIINSFFDVINNINFDTFHSEVREELKENFVTSFEEIDEKTLEIIHKESLKKLNNQREFINSDIKSSDWTYVGMYLLVNKDDHVIFAGNALYDVYKKSYKGESVNMEVYAAVLYEDLKLTDEGKVSTSYNGYTYAPMLFVHGGTSRYVSGYESNEDLFNKVIRNKSSDYRILSTEGMYIES